jgi:hypothetical protein
MTKVFSKIVIPVFCLICGFYVKQKLVNLYNLDVSLLIDYLLVYIPATISNSIISFILDNTKFVSYMMSSGNGDNASNIGEINAGNGDNSNDTGNSVHGDGNNSDNDGNNNSDNPSTPDLEDDSNDVFQDIRGANEEREELSDDPDATTGDKIRADIRMQKAMIASLESMLEIEPNNEGAQSMLAACKVILADLESDLEDLDSDDE